MNTTEPLPDHFTTRVIGCSSCGRKHESIRFDRIPPNGSLFGGLHKREPWRAADWTHTGRCPITNHVLGLRRKVGAA